jgi:CarD family transcriptional regulator
LTPSYGPAAGPREGGHTIPETTIDIEDLEIEREVENIDFEIGDHVVYPHHGAGQVVKKEEKNILGEVREYLTIKILHNDMTVMVPCQNAGKAGLRRVIDPETVKKVLAVLAADVSEMPKNWNRRFKHNRDKIKTGDIYELAEVVRNLAVREQDKGLSTGEKREYLTIKILHNDMTVMVPCANAGKAGLRRVIGEEDVARVLSVLRDDVSQMPKNWNRRFKHNRDKIKTGDVFELAEVVRNLAIREADKGLSTGEKQMFTRAKKILASELMYALEMEEGEAEEYIDNLIEEAHAARNGAAAAAK